MATAAVAMALVAPTGAEGRVVPGFFGMAPQSAPDAKDYELMDKAGVKSVRLPLFWSQVEQVSPFLRDPDWSHMDHAVSLAAKHEMEVVAAPWGTPDWLGERAGMEPVGTGAERVAWRSFLRRAVRRYRAGGIFWQQNPELVERPIRVWEIWNEPNIVTFGTANPERFAVLIRDSGRVIRGADPTAEVVLGGFFGRPLQVPPNLHPGQFLSRFYRAGKVRRWFDGIALHPYVASARAIRAQILNLRRVLRVHGDWEKELYVTEIGWGSNSYQSRWERGLHGQARELDRAFAMLANNRFRWRIGGVWWFSWADAEGPACQFCDSAGLLTVDRHAKPSWYRFTSWTGGDADAVPRADLDTLRLGSAAD